MSEPGHHAVVLGASMGGLLAARVLAEHYRTVTVVERDALPRCPAERRGVPQDRHAHVLLARGPQILAELFPGLLAELAADGVSVWTDGDLTKLCLSFGGHSFIRSGTVPDTMSMTNCYPSRLLLESAVRRRVRAIANVTILDGCDVVGLTSTPDRSRVTGARVADRNAGAETALPADLVVDATGRGSRSPAFLATLGYRRPREDEVVVRLAYASQLMRIPPGVLREDAIVVFPQPGRPTTFVLIGYENDTWMFTLGGMLGVEPPGDRDEMLSFAAQFAPEHAVAALQSAEPLGPVAHYRVPSNRWRRYDQLRRLPEGLLVFGDAIASFNPIYGQGITLAAVEALILREVLHEVPPGVRPGDGRDLPHRFFHRAAEAVRVAWRTAVGADLALPEVSGKRTLSTRLTNTYLERVLRAAESDSVVVSQFLRVIGMLDPPASLLRPDLAWRVATATRHRTDRVAHPGTPRSDSRLP